MAHLITIYSQEWAVIRDFKKPKRYKAKAKNMIIKLDV